MTDAAFDEPVRIFAREFLGIRTGVRVRRTIGITFKRNSRHGDDRKCGKPLFQIIVLRLTFSQAEPPTIIMDYDGDVIGIVESCGATSERRVIESPLRRRDLPNELRKLLAVFVVSCPAALGGKIILIPPLELSLWR